MMPENVKAAQAQVQFSEDDGARAAAEAALKMAQESLLLNAPANVPFVRRRVLDILLDGEPPGTRKALLDIARPGAAHLRN